MKLFDREQWSARINLSDDWPEWLCSECFKGYYNPFKNENNGISELIAESAFVKFLKNNEPGLDSDNYSAHNVIKLECTNPKCLSESLLISTKTNEVCSTESTLLYDDILKPIFFTRPPQIFHIPSNFKDESVKYLYQSFSSFFGDPSGAVNKTRIFLEYLVPKTSENEGKLHHRLEKKFKNDHSHVYALLLACKWIGNDASHEGDIEHQDVLDTYEFIETALSIMFPEDENYNALLTKAKKINDAKKSLSKISK